MVSDKVSGTKINLHAIVNIDKVDQVYINLLV